MSTTEDRNTRYFVDVDVSTMTIVGWDCDNKFNLEVSLPSPHQRVFISKGQFNKLKEKHSEAHQKSAGRQRS